MHPRLTCITRPFGFASKTDFARRETKDQTQILQLAGPGGVGKSTLSWEIGAQLRQSGLSHVLLDADELDRAWPLTEEQQISLDQENLSSFWANAAAIGHQRLVLSGVFLHDEIDQNWIRHAVPNASIHRFVLLASDDELERRVRARELGARADEQLARTLEQARLFRLQHGDFHLVHTDGETVPNLAHSIIERAGWA